MARRYLGVDYGDQRIGLAIAEEDVKVARPWRILEPQRHTAAQEVKQLAEDERITEVIVGLPRNLAGEETPQTAVARRFAAQLTNLGLNVVLQDEAGTSELAHEQYPKQKHIDAEAAAIILQDYLEEL